MAVLLIVKTMAMLFESIRYHFIATTGVGHEWSVIYYIFAFLKGVARPSSVLTLSPHAIACICNVFLTCIACIDVPLSAILCPRPAVVHGDPSYRHWLVAG